MNRERIRVLFGSPVRQHPAVLEHFLTSARKLDHDDLAVDYWFIDNNTEERASQLLAHFAREDSNATIVRHADNGEYICDEKTHYWKEEVIWKVAAFKNNIIGRALAEGYDYVFLVDSDLVLHPKTLVHLIQLGKEIVSEIFWTRWEPGFPELPQVWVNDQYNLYDRARGEALTQAEVLQRVNTFLGQLRVPGVYKVGGLGACTLISQKALRAGVGYKEIYNVSFVGEDRHFCIRAAALGFDLFVDTHYPAFHIYRLSDLDDLTAYKSQFRP